MAHILIVDDDPTTTQLLQIALSTMEFEIAKANSGAEAMNKIQQQIPELILLDLMMPGMNGLEFCKILRSNPDYTNIPIIVLSALDENQHKMDAFEAGAGDYIVKPVSVENLKLHIRSILVQKARNIVQQTPKIASVIAFLGASGGVGTSTLAMNSAVSILDEHPNAVFAELTPGASLSELQFNISSNKSLSDLIHMGELRVTDEVVQQTVIRSSFGLNILPSSQAPELLVVTSAFGERNIKRIISALCKYHHPVFLDLGSGYNARARAACILADAVFIVARSDPPSLKSAIQLNKLLIGGGIEEDIITMALIAFHHTMTQEQAMSIFEEAGATYNVLFQIPPLASLMSSANEQGKPAVLVEPEGKTLLENLRKVIGKLLND